MTYSEKPNSEPESVLLTEKEIHSLITTNYEKLKKVAINVTRDSAKSEDLLQEAICKVLEHRHQYKPETNFVAWVGTIMRNHHYQMFRKYRKEIEDPDDAAASYLSIGANQHHVLELKEAIGCSLLNEAERSLLYLLVATDMTMADLAIHFNIDEGTVKSRIHRARAKLRESEALDIRANKYYTSPNVVEVPITKLPTPKDYVERARNKTQLKQQCLRLLRHNRFDVVMQKMNLTHTEMTKLLM